MGVNTGQSKSHNPDSFRYEYIDGLDRAVHLTPVVRLELCRDPGTETMQLAAIEQGSQMLKLHKPTQSLNKMSLVLVKNYRHDTAFQPHKVRAACWIPTLNIMATSSRESAAVNWINFFDTRTHYLKHRVRMEMEIDVLTYSEGVSLLFACGPGGQAIRGICPQKFTTKVKLYQTQGVVCSMEAVPGHLSTLVLTGSTDGALRVWDGRAGACLEDRTLDAHELGVRKIIISKTSQQLISCGRGMQDSRVTPKHMNRVFLWPLNKWIGDVSAENQAEAYFQKLESEKKKAAPSPSAAIGAKRRQETRDSVSSSSMPKRKFMPGVLEGHEYAVRDIAVADELSLQRPHVVTLDEAGFIRVWDLHTCHCIQVLFMYSDEALKAQRNRRLHEWGAAAREEVERTVRNKLLIEGKIGVDVEQAAADEWMSAYSSDEEPAGGGSALVQPEAGKTEHEQSHTFRSQGTRPSVIAGGSFMETRRSSAIHTPTVRTIQSPHSSVLPAIESRSIVSPSGTHSLTAGDNMSFARARSALYPERGEGRAARLFKIMVNPDRVSKAPGVRFSLRTADLQITNGPNAADGPGPSASFISSASDQKSRDRLTISQYAMNTKRLDAYTSMVARKQLRAELLQATKEKAAFESFARDFGKGTAQLTGSSEGKRMGVPVDSIPSDDESDDDRGEAEEADDDEVVDDGPLSEKSKLKSALCIRCLPTECGGSERKPLLAIGGDKLRVMAFTQEVPQLLPLIATLFAEPTMMICTLSAKNLIVWDILIGRPIRVHDSSVLLGSPTAEISSACLDDRQRKLFIGDSRGHIRCFNLGVLLLSPAAFVKELDPHKEGSAVTHLQYLDGFAEVLSVGTDGQIQVCDDMNIEGYNATTLDSCLLRRFPLPDPQEVPYAKDILTLSDLEAKGEVDPLSRKRDISILHRVRHDMLAAGKSSFYAAKADSDDEYDPEEMAAGGAKSNRIKSNISANFMKKARNAAILQTAVDINSTAVSPQLNLLATCQSGLDDRHWLLLWNLEKTTIEGSLSPFSTLPSCGLISSMMFLEPYPLLWTLDSSGLSQIWVVPPAGQGKFSVLAEWNMPYGHIVTCMNYTDAKCIPCAEHGSLGLGAQGRFSDGLVLFSGDQEGRVHRWRLAGAALPDAVGAMPRGHIVQKRLPDFRLPLIKLKSSQRHSLRAAALAPRKPSVTEALPNGTADHLGVVWEMAWGADRNALVKIEYLQKCNVVLVASVSGLARLWDNDGRLLGTLDTTPRFMAPEPIWAAQVKIEEDSYIDEHAHFVSGTGSHPHGFPRADTSADNCTGVGTGSPYSDDRTSMRHVAVRRVYNVSSISDHQARYSHMAPRSISTKQSAAHHETLADLLIHKAKTSALDRNLPELRQTIYTIVSTSQRVPPGVVFAADAPEQGIVYWHFKPNLVLRELNDVDNATRYRSYVTLIRFKVEGKLSLQPLMAKIRSRPHTPANIFGEMPQVTSVVSDMDAEVRRVLDEQESDDEWEQSDGLALAQSLCASLDEQRMKELRAQASDEIDFEAQQLAKKTGAVLTFQMKRLDPKAGLRSESKRLQPNKFDEALAAQPDYADPSFLRSIDQSVQALKQVTVPAYFSEYKNMQTAVAASSVPISAFPRTELSYAERVKLNAGKLFTDAPLTKFSLSGRGLPKKSKVKKFQETQVTALLGPK